MYVFSYFSKIKAELVKNDAKYLFMCYFTFQAQKITISRDFYLMFLVLVKSKMTTKFGDVTGL